MTAAYEDRVGEAIYEWRMEPDSHPPRGSREIEPGAKAVRNVIPTLKSHGMSILRPSLDNKAPSSAAMIGYADDVRHGEGRGYSFNSSLPERQHLPAQHGSGSGRMMNSWRIRTGAWTCRWG